MKGGAATIAKPFGAAIVAMIVAFNVGASEPFIAKRGQTPQQAVDQWYKQNKGDYGRATRQSKPRAGKRVQGGRTRDPSGQAIRRGQKTRKALQ